MPNVLSAGYKRPTATSKYTKLNNGSTLLRILTSASDMVTYWVEFQENSEGYKKITYPDTGDGKKPSDKAKMNWVFKVWNYETSQVEVWEVSQASIQNALYDLGNSKLKPDWTTYDIEIVKTGEKMRTKYTVNAGDKEPVAEEVKEALEVSSIDLSAMEGGKSPFGDNPQSKDYSDILEE